MRAAVILAFIVIARAQDSSAQFEVASVKVVQDEPGMNMVLRGGPGTSDPTLFVWEHVDLHGLLSRIFNLKTHELSAPDWTWRTRVNINARVSEGATKEQFEVMLRNLIVERFKIAYHIDPRQMPTYDLVITKNGPKLKEHIPSPDDNDRTKWPSVDPKARDADGFPVLPPGPFTGEMGMNGRRATQKFFNASMERLARLLEAPSHRPVHDGTGLTGKYDFMLKWILDFGGPSTEEGSPTLFEALEQQLGLKLESRKSMVDVLVIDHLEKTPADN